MNTYIPSTRIITFGCRDSIFVYPPNCVLIPKKPYRVHGDVFEAKEYLKGRGIKIPKVVIHESGISRNFGGNKGIHKIN